MSEPVNYFSRLSAEECWSLLSGAEVGRVAWNSEEGITVIPVNFAVAGTTITFRTREGAKLARLTQPTEVAFEVDEIDLETAIGWSVLARGVTASAAGAPSVSWLAGHRPVGIALTVRTISGRVVSGYRK